MLMSHEQGDEEAEFGPSTNGFDLDHGSAEIRKATVRSSRCNADIVCSIAEGVLTSLI